MILSLIKKSKKNQRLSRNSGKKAFFMKDFFARIYCQPIEQLKQKNPATAQMFSPLDSTVITLTSKPFWMQVYHLCQIDEWGQFSSEKSR